ncbi:hypothetical protein, partial [Brevibacterium casei]|uniref:hypothetical protein n=1 Tax=Brevibacterium casei TaxID=33889 RepID=UPI0024686580
RGGGRQGSRHGRPEARRRDRRCRRDPGSCRWPGQRPAPFRERGTALGSIGAAGTAIEPAARIVWSVVDAATEGPAAAE